MPKLAKLTLLSLAAILVAGAAVPAAYGLPDAPAGNRTTWFTVAGGPATAPFLSNSLADCVSQAKQVQSMCLVGTTVPADFCGAAYGINISQCANTWWDLVG